jgi:hypothetical protein
MSRMMSVEVMETEYYNSVLRRESVDHPPPPQPCILADLESLTEGGDATSTRCLRLVSASRTAMYFRPPLRLTESDNGLV